MTHDTSDVALMIPDAHQTSPHALRLKRLGIDTYQEPVIYMRSDCHVCRAEGFEAQSRVQVAHNGHAIVATLNVITGDLLAPDEVGLSEVAWRLLGARAGDAATLSHPPVLESLSRVRAKVYGKRLGDADMRAIVRDIAAGRYADIHLSAFIAACAGDRLDLAETVALTRAMTDAGERLAWGHAPVVDKHCVGGLPGNRTTLIVVPIVAAFGLTMPKTSSRAITSPAGTADVMATLTEVELDVPAMRRVVEREGGCIVWGGAVRLSPADDILIRVERPLDLDSEGQLVASVLSKKAAAGSSHVVIDIPVGETAKVRSREAAQALSHRLVETGHAIGLTVQTVVTDGTQPVGRGIGPALEARDVLAVLRREADAPADLRERALQLAGAVLEFAPGVAPGRGRVPGAEHSGRWPRMEKIRGHLRGSGRPARAVGGGAYARGDGHAVRARDSDRQSPAGTRGETRGRAARTSCGARTACPARNGRKAGPTALYRACRGAGRTGLRA